MATAVLRCVTCNASVGGAAVTKTLKDCDLIMKGGVTSGVVYPELIATIGKDYRLHGVGGTSAGAIAAAFAVAAEFRRQENGDTGGFDEVRKSAGFLARKTASLFQPSPDLARLFRFLAGMNANTPRSRGLRTLRALVAAYGNEWLFAVAGVIFLIALLWALSFGWAWFCLMLSVELGLVIATVAWMARAAIRDVTLHLPRADWGICPGVRQPGASGPAFGEWIADNIDRIADRRAANDPLTVGDIERHKITIGAMTTDITSRRPYELPMFTDDHYFSPAEFRRIMPERIVRFMEQRGEGYLGAASGAPADLRRLPERAMFPVFLVARMSLSFPGLIASVPLYRLEKGPPERMVRCLFTDGGLSSNFPIHFFDSILPGRPTFGIALGDAEANTGDAPGDRIYVTCDGRPDLPLPSAQLDGLAAFGWAVIGTAKDWQDTLQSRLPGYRERTVQILLKDAEGGLNLNMDEALIKRLSAYGGEAAATLIGRFNFDEHRRLRATVTMPKVEDILAKVKEKLEETPLGAVSYPELLKGLPPAEFPELPRDWPSKILLPFMRKLAALGAGRVDPDHVLDRVEASVRLRANSGRRPRDAVAVRQAPPSPDPPRSIAAGA
jgi:predicted acylesterase/phospholipase RssA